MMDSNVSFLLLVLSNPRVRSCSCTQGRPTNNRLFDKGTDAENRCYVVAAKVAKSQRAVDLCEVAVVHDDV
jgi:hypothetical protein